jgi:hypothetical protein
MVKKFLAHQAVKKGSLLEMIKKMENGEFLPTPGYNERRTAITGSFARRHDIFDRSYVPRWPKRAARASLRSPSRTSGR